MFGRISNNIPENDVGVCRNIGSNIYNIAFLLYCIRPQVDPDTLRPDEVGNEV